MQLARMTWPQAEAYFRDNDIILLSVGSIECHGKHLPLGTDTLIPQKLLEMIEPLTDVAIAPIIPFGVWDSLSDYPGTVSLGQDTLYQVLTKITQGYRAHGVRRFVVLNGHGGAEETAGVLAVNPTLVDWDSIEDMTLKPVSDEREATGFKTVRFKGVEILLVRPITEVTDNGWIGPDHPKNATEAWGRDMLKACAEYIADFMGACRIASRNEVKTTCAVYRITR